MNAAQSAIVISVSVLIFFCYITDAVYNYADADAAYEQYWSANNHASYPWTDYKVPFCKLERPRGYKYKDYDDENSTPVDLVSYFNFQCPVDVLACRYSENSDPDDDVWYRFSQCPNGKYYYLVSTYVGNGVFAIRSEVAKPIEAAETMYKNYYDGHGTIRWESQRQNAFCEEELPSNANSVDPAFLENKYVVLPSKQYSQIVVQCLVCIYNLKDSGVQRVHYSHAPDGVFYEMRMYDFKAEFYNSEPFFIYSLA